MQSQNLLPFADVLVLESLLPVGNGWDVHDVFLSMDGIVGRGRC